MADLCKKIYGMLRKRMPGGKLYEALKIQRKLLMDEKNSLCKEVMMAVYRKNRDTYFRGGREDARVLRNMQFYCELKSIFHFSLVEQKNAMHIKELVVPVPGENEKSLFAEELLDIALHYFVGLENINRFKAFQGEGSYENPSYVVVEKNDIVLDCGANMGLYSAVASREGAVVYAFEPSNYIIDNYLHITAEGNPNIHIVNAALSDKKGEVEFVIEESNLGHSRIKDSGEYKKTEKVMVITVDDFVQERNLERVDFIKADIEGAERKMLKGATWVLRNYAPKLSICTYHLPDDPEVLERIIKEANPNYTVHHEAKKLYAYCG